MGRRYPGNTYIQDADVYYDRGETVKMAEYICRDGLPSNFMISGSGGAERYELLELYFDAMKEEYPIVLLHYGNVDASSSEFEPFYGMDDMQVIGAIRQLAVSLNYTATPRLDRVIRAHLQILRELEIEASLTGFYYLNQFKDMGQFHEAIMSLPCGGQKAARIWADLGVDEGSDNCQFDLFRSVIDNFAYEAGLNGWNYDEMVDHNCLMAVKRGEAWVMKVSPVHHDLFITYLAEELKACEKEEYILLIDEVEVDSENFLSYLCASKENCHIGIISENAAAQIREEDAFLGLSAKMECMLLFKHGLAKIAERFAEMMGRFECMKVEASQSYSRRAFQILSYDMHDDVRYSAENRYRVPPEDIMTLGPTQAIIFDTVTNQIIYFN